MSKELVARALYVLEEHNCGVYIDGGYREVGDQLIAHIRAVDAQYPEGYDEEGGLEILEVNGRRCYDCWRTGGHAPDCHKWNTRVALLALCRDILGEK